MLAVLLTTIGGGCTSSSQFAAQQRQLPDVGTIIVSTGDACPQQRDDLAAIGLRWKQCFERRVRDEANSRCNYLDLQTYSATAGKRTRTADKGCVAMRKESGGLQ